MAEIGCAEGKCSVAAIYLFARAMLGGYAILRGAVIAGLWILIHKIGDDVKTLLSNRSLLLLPIEDLNCLNQMTSQRR